MRESPCASAYIRALLELYKAAVKLEAFPFSREAPVTIIKSMFAALSWEETGSSLGEMVAQPLDYAARVRWCRGLGLQKCRVDLESRCARRLESHSNDELTAIARQPLVAREEM